MKLECCRNNSEMFATNLRQNKDSKKLVWDSAQGADVLIVQTPCEEVVELEELCQGLEESIDEIDVLQGKYVRVLPTVWCRYVSAIEKAKSNGCEIHEEPATYTVYACAFDRDKGIGRIYASQNDGMIKPSCHIQVQFHVDVIKEMKKTIIKKRMLFRKQEMETFYSLNFPETSYVGYRNGDLVYCVGDFEVPITNEMFKQKKIYIKTDEKPIVKSKNKGIRLL